MTEDSIKVDAMTPAEESGVLLDIAESIHAGFPSPAADHTGERIDIVHEMTIHPDTTFYARVSGDSMRDAAILDGDIVVIDRSLTPQDGDYIVAEVDGEFTIKEFRYDAEGQCAWLIPHNEMFQPIRVDASNEFVVWGVVTHAIHKTRG